MNYSGFIEDDIANGPGIRTSLFVSGCRNHCPGCFNKEQQDFNYGNPFTEDIEDYILNSINDDYHDGISILGGDPLEPENATTLLNFVCKFRKRFGTKKTIWLYTGYYFEDIDNMIGDDRRNLIYLCDVIVDGPFEEDKKDITLKFKGSSNQRIINMNKVRSSSLHGPFLLY